MSILPILHFPDARLRKIAVPVLVFDEQLKKIAADMAETMYDAPGVGLAATQVNVHLRLIVMDISETKDALLVLVNPEIIKSEGLIIGEEGCLSVPTFFAEVKRAEKVTFRYQDLDGKPHEIEATELLSVCIQHEIDHLNGKVFVDHLSRLKQARLLHKLKKQAIEDKKEAQKE